MKSWNWIGIFICCNLWTGIVCFSQSTDKLLKDAERYFNTGAYEEAIPIYRDILLQDNSLEAKIKLAEAYYFIQDLDKSEYWYKQILPQLASQPEYKLRYAQLLQSNGKCEEAKRWFLEYGKHNPWGATLAKGCDKIEDFSVNKDKYETWLLPINSLGSDFGAIPYEDGILFCSNREESVSSSSSREKIYLDIYYSKKQQGNVYTPPKPLKGRVNSQYNDGPFCFSPDKETMYLTRNSYYQKKRDKTSISKLNIFIAKKIGKNKWGNLESFQHNKKHEFSVGHPTLSHDGQSLYFISDYSGDGQGYGGTDLYVSTKIDTFWSEPINLGETLNTPGNEMFPYIHSDGTLYFASNGHAGLGGLDIFYTKQKGNGQWVKPKNLGKPFNSTKDDFGLSLVENKNQGYFSSNRGGGFGDDDIYYFSLAPQDLYALEEENTDLAFQHPPITSVMLNETLNMAPLYFTPGSWTVSAKIEQELEKLIIFLKKTPEIKVELGSHTDARGDDLVNLEISRKRAEAVREYLLLQGVSPNKVEAIGYGEKALTNHCTNNTKCTDEQHEENNRIEIKVAAVKGIGNGKISDRNSEKEYRRNNKKDPITTDVSNNTLTENGLSNPSNNKLALAPAPTNKKPSLNYKVYLGPYKDINNNIYYTFAELNTDIDLENTKKGMMIVLGPYDTISEAEKYKKYAEEQGAKKAKITVFSGDEKTDLDIKKLKKSGAK